MKKLLFPLGLFIYVNLTWQIMVWGEYLIPSIGKIILFFLFPIAFATGLFLFFEVKLDDQRSYFFLAAGILMIAFFGLGIYATRISDYTRYVYGYEGFFQGQMSELDENSYLFYTINGFLIKNLNDGEFGVSYSRLSRKNSTTHYKHFAIPVFDEKNPAQPKLWLCSTYSSGSSRVDDYNYSIHGFKETGLGKALNVSTIYGKKLIDTDCSNAAYQYLKKKNLERIENPLILWLVNETAEEYYQSSKRHFWILIILLNILFFGIPAITFPKETKTT
jgi:hypothetical protein